MVNNQLHPAKTYRFAEKKVVVIISKNMLFFKKCQIVEAQLEHQRQSCEPHANVSKLVQRKNRLMEALIV